MSKLFNQLGVPPPEVTPAEVQAANADIPFYSARAEMSTSRAEELCASLAKARGDAEALPALNHYFTRYFKDDDELLKRFPSHRNFIRDMDFKTRLFQTITAPEYFRKACSAKRPDAQMAKKDMLDLFNQLGPPPPEVTPAEVQSANEDIPFFNAVTDMSNARVEEVCASLAKTRGDAEALPALNHYFTRYFKDDDELLKRFPSHSNFIRNMDFKTRLLQRVRTPEYFRKACSAN